MVMAALVEIVMLTFASADFGAGARTPTVPGAGAGAAAAAGFASAGFTGAGLGSTAFASGAFASGALASAGLGGLFDGCHPSVPIMTGNDNLLECVDRSFPRRN